MNRFDKQKQIKYKHKIKMYHDEMDKITKLYPCTLCGKVKYIINEKEMGKACESECEHIKLYHKTVDEHKTLLLRNLNLHEPI